MLNLYLWVLARVLVDSVEALVALKYTIVRLQQQKSNKTLTQQEDAMEFETRQYVIFNVSELDSIDFSQVLETSADTIRRSVDGTLTFVKWDGNVPLCVESLTTKGEYMTHSEILAEMNTEAWTIPMSEEM
jgi:hypothetical protein